MKINAFHKTPLWIALTCVAALATATQSYAQPTLMPIHGSLVDHDGVLVDASEAQVTFRLYRSAVGGAPVHTEAVVLDLDAGSFAHLLGSGDTLNLAEFDGANLYLAVQVEGETELQPRWILPTTPYAAFAREAGAVDWSGVTDVPPEIAEGGGYTGGIGVAINPTTRQVLLDSAGCPPGGGLIWDGTTFTCANPAGSVSGGFGVSVSLGTLSIDPTQIQRRSATSCPFGVRILSENGTITCAADNNVDTSAYGRSCTGVGQVLRGFNASGTPICAVDQNTNVFGAQCAGANESLVGFTGSGAPICALTAFIDTNVYGTDCGAGNLLRGYSATGQPLCAPDQNTNTNVFGQLCSGALVLRGYQANGSPICVTDQNTNTTYSVQSSSGLRLVGTDFRLANRIVQRESCEVRECGNGDQCTCPGQKFAIAWRDPNCTFSCRDYVECCTAALAQ